MVSERTRRRIERLLDEADEAIASGDWSLAQRRAQDVLAFDPESQEAAELLEAAERRLGSGATPKVVEQIASAASGQGRASATTDGESADIPTSFAGGRYEVKRFLGEGGKKRVYLAHDGRLDHDVAIALIKSEGLTQEGIARLQREGQAIGELAEGRRIR